VKRLPQHDSGCDGDVEGVFRAELGYFDAIVREIDDFLLYSFDLVTEYESVFLFGINGEGFEGDAVFHLFHGKDGKTFVFQFLHGICRFLEISPIHAFLGAECCFVNFPVGWGSRDATKVYFQ